MVSVRQRRFVVAEVSASAVHDDVLNASVNGAVQHLVTLQSLEDDALGEELQVIWEIEPGACVVERSDLPAGSGFDAPDRLDAFLDAIRWGASSQADQKNIQAPFRSGIDIEDYQLDPVVRAIQMPRVNLLIADDVGLGKTIESGLVVQELILRHRARKILVVCPAGLQVQWLDQMRDKFGLDFRIVDTELLKVLRRKRGIRVNPWSHYPRLITSIDFLKRERVLRRFQETLPSAGESVYPRRYDVLIVDEAHNCAPSGRGKYATDSQRTQAIRRIAPHFEHRLFLTATPHNGYSESFSALLELLDSQRFARGTPPDEKQLEAIRVRRLKSELPPRFDGTPRFPQRVIAPLEVRYSDEERVVHDALKRYTALRLENVTSQQETFAAEFVLKTLKKRLFSCPAAFATTLERHQQSLKTAGKRKPRHQPAMRILQKQVQRIDEAGDDDECDASTDDALDATTQLFRPLNDEETALLKTMTDWASTYAARSDAKADVLLNWLLQHVKPDGAWADRRVIIFTEYRRTQLWLHERLVYGGFRGDGRIMIMYGGMNRDQREEVKAAFQEDPRISPVRILLATDAASEGIDLQMHCSDLIHYEIPWNPNRLEQRNGRIDRHGQKAAEVNIYHFVGSGYDRAATRNTNAGDLDGDLEFLMRAAEKINVIREDLGNVGPVIAQQVEEAMLGRRSRLDTKAAEKAAGPVKAVLRFKRDLRARIEELRNALSETKRELRLQPENIQKVVEVALDISGQPPLIPVEVEGIWPVADRKQCPVFRLPPLKGSWASCSAGLVRKHTGDIRPIVFDHQLAADRTDVVLCHLNHRLVQMCLRLLRAEVWSMAGARNLHRITARTAAPGALTTPAVIAHARLVVVGGGSHRLHEEVITAGGYLIDGTFKRMTLDEVEQAIQAQTASMPSRTIQDRLMALYPKIQDRISNALEVRMRQRTTGLERDLVERAEKETRDITTILRELERTIREKLHDPALAQPLLIGWTDPERQQLERNMTALHARLKEIPEEIEREEMAILERYLNLTPRMFPVSVTFVVPDDVK